MTAPKRQIYLLSPKKYSPETIAVAFAKTSRSPETFQTIADELTDESTQQFNEKWVVGYGHSSVAEHAVLHLAFENASRLAMEAIESNRLASYTEKSTRYQKWDRDQFYCPPEIIASSFLDRYNQMCTYLFDTYLDSLEPVKAEVVKTNPRNPNETDELYDRRIRSKYVDACRFLLPAASLANAGMTVNARELESSIRKWLSHPLQEVQDIGRTVKQAALAEVPTLVKYADPQPLQAQIASEISDIVNSLKLKNDKPEPCKLIHSDVQGEDHILAAALYRFGRMPFEQALVAIKDTSVSTQIIDILFSDLSKFDTPIRELEHSYMTFDLVMDQGAYAEFKRHRMMTQTPQLLGCNNGYAVPAILGKTGVEEKYRLAMDAAMMFWNELVEWNPDVAQYIVPNGYNRRVLATFNLREAFAFCQLRSAPNAHFSIRRIAQMMAIEIKRIYPGIAKHLRITDEPWQKIEIDHFSAVD